MQFEGDRITRGPPNNVSLTDGCWTEVDRAIDNLVKSGKFYTPGPRPMLAPVGRGFSEFGAPDATRSRGASLTDPPGPRMHGGRHSVSDFDPNRSPSASNLQSFYASQRHQGRHGDPDQMMQAKRRMAAQRERELRNYHQEQQYNRSKAVTPGRKCLPKR